MKQHPICVLSVGRSGSSLVTRAINLLGVDLGADDDLMPATEQNRDGFWESMPIWSINERLLECLGGSWYRPPRLAPGWTDDERLLGLRQEATRVVGQLARPGVRWGFKDPRTIPLLPFWREIVGEMDYLICVRRPHAVISSVEHMGLPGTEPLETAMLWLDMNAAALAQTATERRKLIFYEDWFEDPRRVARQLAAFIHGEASPVDPEALRAIDAFLDPRLRRADEAAIEVVAPELEAMYEHLRLVADPGATRRYARDRETLVAQTLADAFRSRQGAGPQRSTLVALEHRLQRGLQ
jgi:hypothetical protein